MLVLVPHGGAD